MSVKINDENASGRIEEAIHVITHCYEEWDAEAQQKAQQAYWHAIESQVRVLLEGMVFDEDPPPTLLHP